MMPSMQVVEEKSAVDQRREEKIAAWCEKIRSWDWLPVVEAVKAADEAKQSSASARYGLTVARGSFELGAPTKLMQRSRKDYSPQDWWVETYCFDAALKQVAAEHGLKVIVYTDGTVGVEMVSPDETD